MTLELGAVPRDLKYTEDHEWLRDEDGLARVGITEFAQDQLGDVVFVELPGVGDGVTAGEAFGVVESVKAASDLLCPITGTVTEINEKLDDDPELVNSDPYGDGWMIVIEPSSPDELDSLMGPVQYVEMIARAE
ncbi:MAG: glycine cleavage system protein GcvH [Anaerolineae bacterium]